MFVLFYIQLLRCKYVIKRSVQFSFYRDLEIWVIGHSRSFKVMPFKSLGTVFYSPSIVTMAVSVVVCEIFSVKSGVTLKTGLGFVQGHWKWHHLIDRIRVPIRLPYGDILYRLRDIANYWQKNREIFIPHLYLVPRRG